MKKFKGLKGMILLMVMALLIVGYYYYLSNKSVPEKEETSEEALTAVEEVLVRNLETNYPQTPREVVKYFVEITECVFNEELTDEEVEKLAMKLRELYDDELVANQTEEEYLEQFKADILVNQGMKRKLFNYSLSSSIDVETFSEDGYEWARLHCIFGIQQESLLYKSDTLFLLRKDADGHYKIYGWQLVKSDSE